MPFPRLFTGLLLASALAGLGRAAAAPAPLQITSPDGALRVTVDVPADGAPTYTVRYRDTEVLRASRLGLQLREADLTRGLRLADAGPVTAVTDAYTLLSDKRTQCRYAANARTLRFAAVAGLQLSVEFRVSNDGVAFRYAVAGPGTAVRHITAERTTFHLPPSAKSWLHPHAKAGTGWSNTQPSYEEYYVQGAPVGAPSPIGEGWSFPALFEVNNHWVLLTEAGMGRTYCGAHLAHASPDAEYGIAFPQARERMGADAPLFPESALPWVTPWRIVTVGPSLATIVESTLTTDLSPPAPATQSSVPGVNGPGKASWSWVMLGDDHTTYDVQRRFIDFAAEMKWRYCLVDALWDTQIGYDKLAELVTYAQTKNVALLVWYNSNGTWNDAPQTPKNLMPDPATRRREFARLQQMGIAGVKIDFFGGDGQSFMQYYQDLLTDAAAYGLLVNFHGATIPRGWHRTYPNLMTMEAVRGFEFVTFEAANADQQPTHCATLPFTRNAVGPMDFTPVCFGELTGKQRRTSNAFELALSVVLQSGIQHYALTPDDLAKQPAYVADFLRRLPARWDDVKLLAGYPGQYAVLARQAAGKWYVAGINGGTTPREIAVDLATLGIAGGTLIADGATDRAFVTRAVPGGPLRLTLPAHGGFVVRPD